jgi:hypothetical protein
VTDAEVNDGGTIELHGHSNRIFGQSNKVLQEKYGRRI